MLSTCGAETFLDSVQKMMLIPALGQLKYMKILNCASNVMSDKMRKWKMKKICCSVSVNLLSAACLYLFCFFLSNVTQIEFNTNAATKTVALVI